MTSNEKLIYDKLVEKYPGALKAITQLSHNSTGGRDFIVSSETGFDYDMVVNHSAAYPEHHKEKSPDALFCVSDKLYFVEFKEGGHNKHDIRLKIHEGVTTLYMFTKLHLPAISREDFFNLSINYAVVARETQPSASSFQTALTEASKKYQLKNIEGFIVKDTRYTARPIFILDLLKRVTSNRVTYIDISDNAGNLTRYS